MLTIESEEQFLTWARDRIQSSLSTMHEDARQYLTGNVIVHTTKDGSIRGMAVGKLRACKAIRDLTGLKLSDAKRLANSVCFVAQEKGQIMERKSYDVFMQVNGWVKLGEVDATNSKEARVAGEKLVWPKSQYAIEDLEDDILEISTPLVLDICRVLETEGAEQCDD